MSDPRNYSFMPKHDVADRSIINHNGAFIPECGVFVRSGSISAVDGSTTGSIQLNFDTSALRIRRIEVFHSGAASAFNFKIENSTPNTGSYFDPRDVVVCYRDIPGSVNFKDGVDQIEDMFVLTDNELGQEGNLYAKFMPFGSGLNDFKYLMFFEATILYVNRVGENA